MRKPSQFILLFFIMLCLAPAAQAGFVITSAIVEFQSDGPRQQDIEIVSQASGGNQYIVSDIDEVLHPGGTDEVRRPVKDPAQSMLLVTPDKTILAEGSRKVLRFVLLKNPDNQEHIYRVTVKPIIRGVDNNAPVGLKVLVAYEVLVIVRPAAPIINYHAERQGKFLMINNPGNTNVLFESGQQCLQKEHCQNSPAARVYASGATKIALPLDGPVIYSIWDGKATTEKRFD